MFFLYYFDARIYESRDGHAPDCRRGDPTITQEKCIELELEYLDKLQREADRNTPPEWYTELEIFCVDYLEKEYDSVDSCMGSNAHDFMNPISSEPKYNHTLNCLDYFPNAKSQEECEELLIDAFNRIDKIETNLGGYLDSNGNPITNDFNCFDFYPDITFESEKLCQVYLSDEPTRPQLYDPVP